MPSSSANCGAGAYQAQCVGAWDSSIDSCVIDGSGTSGPTEFYYQGGMHGWRITNTVLAMNGTALRAFDIVESSVAQSTLVGNNAVRWTDEYTRDLWSAGDMSFTGNVVAAWAHLHYVRTRVARFRHPANFHPFMAPTVSPPGRKRSGIAFAIRCS